MSLFTVDLTSLRNLERYLQVAPEKTNSALKDTINGAIRYSYAEGSRQIRAEVNLPQDYIGSVANGNRLTITRYATPDKLLASMSASTRAVSLARFARGGVIGGKGGVSVEVKPGQVKRMKSAFLIKLQRGKNPVSDDNYNLGLAIRLKPGQTVFNKTKVANFSSKDKHLYLLYGPSVDQVFNQVRGRIEPKVYRWIEQEFARQIARQLA